MLTAISCHDLRFCWPEGELVFEDLTFTIGPGKTGLIGANGAGKSTLLRLMKGEFTPSQGSITVAGRIGYLPQDLPLQTEKKVEDILGVAHVRQAFRALEAGDTHPQLIAAVEGQWDAEERARAELDRLALSHVDFDRTVESLSGGEAVLLGVAGEFFRRPDVLLLDEPTNNLDGRMRQRLYETVSSYKGVLVVVSHDRELLRRMDQIAELRAGHVATYGGNIDDYEAAVAIEQEAAQRMVRAAEADLRRQKNELIEARQKLQRRKKYGQKMWDSKREPKIVMGARKRQAQVSAGKHLTMHQGKWEEAEGRLTEAVEGVRNDKEIRIELPTTEVPSGRHVAKMDALLRGEVQVALDIYGPERIALTGRNGAGKTTLLETLVGLLEPLAGSSEVFVPFRYAPQRLSLLDDNRTIVENIAHFAPASTMQEIRANLARFLFRGDRVEQRVATLSGGERFRATLAALLLATPAPQFLLLDEPTNNVDMASVRQLSQALNAYRGALIVVSHDMDFLQTLGITRWLRLEGGLQEVSAL